MAVAVMLGLVYGWALVVALSNFALMRRPKGKAAANFEVMVPARDEAQRLPYLLPALIQGGCRVTVFDDGSTDGTGEVARNLGATVVRGQPHLPTGWKGKPHACHQLASAATAEWVLFLDADTRPSPDFVERFSAFLAARPPQVKVVTGFPRMLPGAGIEPAYLFWVPWILLATNPFGLVARTGKGHNMFLNGQVTAWRREALTDLAPFEHVKDQVLDDVMMGRYLARRQVRVEVADLSGILSVKMYDSLGEAKNGMRKNTADVVPGPLGYLVFAALLLCFAALWVAQPIVFVVGLISAWAVNGIVRMPWWAPLAWPVSLAWGAATAVESGLSRGSVTWKGRSVR